MIPRELKRRMIRVCQSLLANTGYGRSVSEIAFYQTLQERRRVISKRVRDRLGPAVAHGLFEGLILPTEYTWSDGDFTAKVLGCYEAELLSHLQDFVARVPDIVINVGCADGYYAVGLARIVACAVHAIDIDPKAIQTCQLTASLNGMSGRVTTSSESNAEALRRLTSSCGAPLIVSDCEGAEFDLLDPSRVPSLSLADMMIECHDLYRPGCQKELAERFAESHEVVSVAEGARDPNRYECLTSLPSLDRWLAVCEFRPERISWLICRSRGRKATAKTSRF
jgi:Ribosomal protein L11 methyltransferase (PrmA)